MSLTTLWGDAQSPFAATDPLRLLLSLLISLLITKSLATLIYNAYFHPLCKYPGPLLARSTNLAYWAVTIRGDLLPWIQSIHATHGATVRIGPNTLSYTSPQAWRDIYGHRTGPLRRKANPKDRFHYAPDVNGRHGLNALFDDDEHGRVRRIFAHAFSDRALREQEPLIVRFVDHLVANVRRHHHHRCAGATRQRPLDLMKLITCTTFDVMGDLTFGEPLGLLEKGEYSPWVEAMFAWMKAGDISRIVLEYPVLGWLAKHLTPKALLEQQRLHFAYAAERVDRRIEKGGQKPDIWNLVLEQPEGRRLDRGAMHVNASIFMIAGTETTATLLSGLLYFLCKNPEKMEKLCEEIRGSFKSDEELTIESLQRLKYLAACLEEALRLYPPLPIGPPREVHPDGNIICGQWVPGGTRLSVAQYTAYRLPQNFKDPESFIPERWLPNTGYDGDKKDVLQPFSYGPRNCIGKNLAYHEMRIIAAKFLWNFDFELCPESDGWINQKIWTLWAKPPLWMIAKPIR